VVFERDLTAARQAVEQTRTQANEYAILQTQATIAEEELAQQQIAVRDAETIATTTRAAADEFTRLVAAQQETEHAHTVAQQAAATARVDHATYEKLTADLTATEQAAEEAASAEAAAATTLATAEQQQTAQQTGAALRRWLGAQRASAAVTQPEARMAAGAAEVAAAERTTTTTTAAVVAARRRLLLPLIGGGLALLVGLGVFAAGQPLLVASALGLIGVAGLAVAGWAATQLGPARQAADAANRALDTARQQMVQLAADHRAAESLGGGTAALAEAAADLVRLGVRIPTDEAAAEAQLAALPLATDPALTTDLATHRDALDIIRQRRSAQTTRAIMLREQLAAHPGAAHPALLAEAEATHAAAVVVGQERLTIARVALMGAGIIGVVSTPEPPDAELVALVREAMAERQTALATAQRTLDTITTRYTLLTEQIARHPGAEADTRLAEHNRQVEALLEEQAANQTAVEAQASACTVAPTAEAVQEARLAVDQALATGRAALAALPARRETLDQLHRQQAAAHAAAMGEQAWLTAHPQALAEAALATHRQEAAAAADQYGAQAAQIEEQAAVLALPAQAARVQQALGATVRDHQALQTILTEQRPQLAQEHTALLTRISTDEAQFAAVWHRLPPLPAPLAVPATDHPSATELQTLDDAVAAHLAELDEEGVRARLTAMGREDGALAAEEKQAVAAAASAAAELRRLLAAQQVVADLTAESIAAGYPFFAEVTAEDAARYEEEEQEQELQLRNLLRQREEGAARLGVDAATLEVAACEAAVQAARREIAVKARALQMVDLVRQRMIAKVIPSTTHNLCQLLPLLTAGRYRDCQLTGDYKLQIWDEGAGRYVAKNIFSGGTRDQFSLALRLAFALATLPEELGTTPGFIFLDEPLSSFDGPRTEALVRLLTQGAVADSFHQIFVISHNRMFDRQAFTHHLLLEGGRIADHDLDRAPLLANNGLVAAGALPL
jgi:hypothetical protein